MGAETGLNPNKDRWRLNSEAWSEAMDGKDSRDSREINSTEFLLQGGPVIKYQGRELFLD